ncbi:MAG: hypothetical protein NT099_04430 [Candidatus Saganbacteria bacterium]|nr:hypothetical protein [Candidatus Saganbacteria bacterium]
MSNITINPYCSSKWGGNIWEITDEEAGLKATVTETGGRLISLEVDGQELVYSKAELFSKIPDVLQLDRKDVKWDQILLGGEKTWIAPQDLFGGKVPFLIPDLGHYTIEPIADGLKLTSEVCPETGLQVVRQICFGTDGPGTFRITAQLVNHSEQNKLVAPWSVFQLLAPANVTVGPLLKGPEEFEGYTIPSGVFIDSTRQGYYEMVLGATGQSFKVGFYFSGEQGGFNVSFPSGHMLMESFAVPKGAYPHKGRAELYFGTGYFETEVLGPLEIVKQGKATQPLVVDYRML